ncbi:hypothetical protein VR41_00110 [Streptomyces sp. NRRL B-1568]|nr:hypothetical protein VR41_00110 [Streptomyces sp. NRRL B-1568]
MSTHRERVKAAYDAERRIEEVNRARAALAHERLAVAVLAAVEAGEDAAGLALNPVKVEQLVSEARALAPVPAGRIGRSPAHVAMRYATGEISRDEMIEALSTWPYVPVGPRAENLLNDFRPSVAGSFDDVESALHQQYIDGEAYDTILRRYAQRGR